MKGCSIVIFVTAYLLSSFAWSYEIFRKKIPPKHCVIRFISYPVVCPDNISTELADKLIEQNRFSEAALIQRCYIAKHPGAKSVYIDYADTQTVLGNTCESLDMLDRYQQLFGQDDQYLKTLARVYADAEYYDSALFINHLLLKKYPRNDYIIATEATALYASGRPAAALYEYNQLLNVAPGSEELPAVYDEVVMPLMDNLSVGFRYADFDAQDRPLYIPSGPQYIAQNDSIQIYRVPVILQKYLTPDTSLLFKAESEAYHASRDSGLLTIRGEQTVRDYDAFFGINTFINPHIQLQALVGDLSIAHYHDYFVYSVVGSFKTSETLTIGAQFSHDLFRPPEIYNGSPLMVSLGIRDTQTRFHFNQQIDLQSELDIDLRNGRLSDDNAYYFVKITPGTVVYNDDSIETTLIMDLNWFGFRRNNEEFSGYYSPSLYQSYSLGAIVDYSPIDPWHLEFYGSLGAVKDNFTEGLGFATAWAFLSRYSFFKNFDIVGGVSYTYEQIDPSYQEVDAFLGLNWRF